LIWCNFKQNKGLEQVTKSISHHFADWAADLEATGEHQPSNYMFVSSLISSSKCNLMMTAVAFSKHSALFCMPCMVGAGCVDAF
jgi:hypothetical protein